MLFPSIVSVALAQALTVSAATMVVTVAQNNKFQFTPNSITAQPGDMVAFNFVAQNHSVVSANANTPCQPEKNAIFSDFQPVAGNPKAAAPATATGNTPMFMLPITDTQPMYIYCSQAQHCQQGMVMVINPPNANSVKQFQQKAAQANNNVSPRGGMSGGSVVNNAAGTNPRNVLGANAGDAAKTTAKTGKKNGNGGKNGNAGGNGGAAAAGLAGLLAGKGNS